MPAPVQPLPTIGELNDAADPKVRAALAELQSILAGNADAANLADGAVGKAKLATTALNAFLQLATNADHKIAFGAGVVAFAGLGNSDSVPIPHGLGRAPAWAYATPDFRVPHGDQSACHFGPRSWDATNITWRGRLVNTAYAFGIDVPFLWIAVG